MVTVLASVAALTQAHGAKMAGFDPISALISGVSSIAGGAIGAQGAKDAAQINAAEQERTNQENINYQQEFAQNGIQWKVADAVKAGINPLVALGANTQSFQSVTAPQPGASNAGAQFGRGLSDAGQNVARAISSAQSADDQAFTTAQRALSLQKDQAQIDFINSQIRASDARTMNQPGNGPPTPMPSQTYFGGIPSADTVQSGSSFAERWAPVEKMIKIDPDKVTSGHGTTTAGIHPEVSMGRTADGSLYPEPSHDMSVAMFNPWSQRAWTMRNMIMPFFLDSARPPEFRGPYGHYDPMFGYSRRSTPRDFWDRPLDALTEGR